VAWFTNRSKEATCPRPPAAQQLGTAAPNLLLPIRAQLLDRCIARVVQLPVPGRVKAQQLDRVALHRGTTGPLAEAAQQLVHTLHVRAVRDDRQVA